MAIIEDVQLHGASFAGNPGHGLAIDEMHERVVALRIVVLPQLPVGCHVSLVVVEDF